MALPKCKKCKEEIDKDDVNSFIKKSSGYFHVNCEEAKAKPKKAVCCNYCKKEFENKEDIVKRGSLKLHQECVEPYQKSIEIGEAKVRERTCPHCSQKVNPMVDAVDTGAVTYHKACYDLLQRQKKNKEELFNYIALKYNVTYPTGAMIKQVNDFHEKRGYSYKGMYTTLKYIFEVQKIPTKDGVGLGLIPYYFDKAKAYHQKISKAGASANGVTIDNTVVKIRSAEPKQRMKTGYIDLYSL